MAEKEILYYINGQEIKQLNTSLKTVITNYWWQESKKAFNRWVIVTIIDMLVANKIEEQKIKDFLNDFSSDAQSKEKKSLYL